MMISRSIRDFVDAASSNEPTPGGGSVSALAAALGTSMGLMAANFTTDPKKYGDRLDRINGFLAKLVTLRENFLNLAQQDIDAYQAVRRAYGMPKDSDQAKQLRKQTIQESLKVALDPPLETVRCCAAVLEVLVELVDFSNPYLLSDVAVSAILAEGALRGARMNVEVNLALLKNKEFVQTTRTEVNGLAEKVAGQMTEVVDKVEAKVSGS